MSTAEPVGTDAREPKAKGPRARKAKPTSEPKGKRSLNLSLSQSTYERLAIHAMRDGVTISELVTKLAETHLREWHLTRTATRSAGEPQDAA